MALVGVDGSAGAAWYILKGTDENDIMSGSGEYPAGQTEHALTFYGYNGNDTITNAQKKSVIYGGAGNDSIRNYGFGTSIEGGAGNDYIFNNETNAVIGGSAEEGNDTIENSGSSVTINAGTGRDRIINSGSYVLLLYAAGDGSDYIEGFDESCTLKITSGTLDAANSNGTDIFLTFGDHTITLAGAAVLESLNVFQDNTKLDVKIDKNISNYQSDTTVKGGSGNDTIINDGGNNVSVNAGAGDDSVQVSGQNVTVGGGTGNDYIRREWGVGTAFVYTGGNDTIHGFDNLNSALVIADSYTTLRNENDHTVTITVAGKGTITLVDYWEDKVNIVSSLSDVKHYTLIWNNDSNKTVNAPAATTTSGTATAFQTSKSSRATATIISTTTPPMPPSTVARVMIGQTITPRTARSWAAKATTS